ncbi:MAG: hypothetical protein FGM15_07060 [Chthoniobacterales bacterium]|nr:hypothetical protein [Chthoniobacterales bacterium]
MLDNLAQLEQRARQLYAPVMKSQDHPPVYVCERDEIAEARQRMRYRLAPVAAALVALVADMIVAPRYLMRWLRTWKRMPQIG